MVGALAWLMGAVSVQCLADLPSQQVLLGICPPGCLLMVFAWRRFPWVGWVGTAVVGFCWAAFAGKQAMANRWPGDWEGRDVQVEAHVQDLPESTSESTRFMARVTSLDRDVPWEGTARLTWYRTADAGPAAVGPCETWRLTVRLKRPRGFVNPGGADAERNALARGMDATGYVRDVPSNRRSSPTPLCVDALRQRIARGIAARVPVERDAALLTALAVGDTRSLTLEDWQIARGNGVSHLIAISGFHVGVAALGGAWLVALAYFAMPWMGQRWPKVQAMACGGFAVAFAYGALAGFGIATVRTLLMIAVIALCRCLRRAPSGAHAMALASTILLACDPLSVLLPGFWLSFVGVAFLMFALNSASEGVTGFAKGLLQSQLLMSTALLPLTMWFFGESSLVGALSNLIAVPLVSLVIVPLALLGAIFLLVFPVGAGWVLWPASRLVHGQWWWLEWLERWPGAHWFLPEVSIAALVLAMIGAIWLFLPRGWPARWLGVLGFAPLLMPPLDRPEAGAFQVWTLDVGQGLAVLIRTRSHALLYDAGARFRTGFDLGEAVVLRSLRGMGINRLDAVVISHADNDHAGGAGAVVRAFPKARRLAGEPERMPLAMDACTAGQSWEWDHVRFEMLLPGGTPTGASPNDRSCVLLVEHGGGRFLLTGDITTRAETRLPASLADGRPLVLQVGHHGSRTSSGEGFLQSTRPALGLISAGWRNRFGHPHPKVVERFERHEVPLLNTAVAGAIRVDFPANAPPRVTATWRQDAARYWRER